MVPYGFFHRSMNFFKGRVQNSLKTPASNGILGFSISTVLGQYRYAVLAPYWYYTRMVVLLSTGKGHWHSTGPVQHAGTGMVVVLTGGTLVAQYWVYIAVR